MAERKKPAAKSSRKKGSYRPLKAPPGVPTVGDILEGRDGAEDAPGNPETAGIGHNKPPKHVLFAEHVDDLFAEAQNFLDGDPISNDEQAEAVTKLKGLLSDALKGAEAERKAEKQPFLDAGKAVDEKWNPIKAKAEKAIKVAQRALTPWLEMVAAENERKQREAQEEAERAAARLREAAIASRESSSLIDEDEREALEREAKEAKRRASQAAKTTSVVRTEAGAATLRTVWLVAVKDHRALLTHYLKNREDVREALKDWLFEQAKRDVRGGARVLPGCNIWDERRAV